jgi:transcriptional regulator
VYIPKHFEVTDESQIKEFLGDIGACDLITVSDGSLLISTLPMLFVQSPVQGSWGSLQGHLARQNPHVAAETNGVSVAIVRGVSGYVSPGWYPSKLDGGKVVPTWDYVVAHVYGRLMIKDDPIWVEDLVDRLTNRHEAPMEKPWSVAEAPEDFIAGQLRAIVGVELIIERIEAKFKLSQNRSKEDVQGVIRGLSGIDDELAQAIRQANDL